MDGASPCAVDPRITLSRSLLLAILLTIGLPGLVAAQERRMWQDNTGNFRVEARLKEAQADNVILELVDGQSVTVPRRRLSLADLTYLATLAEKKTTAEPSSSEKAGRVPNQPTAPESPSPASSATNVQPPAAGMANGNQPPMVRSEATRGGTDRTPAPSSTARLGMPPEFFAEDPPPDALAPQARVSSTPDSRQVGNDGSAISPDGRGQTEAPLPVNQMSPAGTDAESIAWAGEASGIGMEMALETLPSSEVTGESPEEKAGEESFNIELTPGRLPGQSATTDAMSSEASEGSVNSSRVEIPRILIESPAIPDRPVHPDLARGVDAASPRRDSQPLLESPSTASEKRLASGPARPNTLDPAAPLPPSNTPATSNATAGSLIIAPEASAKTSPSPGLASPTGPEMPRAMEAVLEALLIKLRNETDPERIRDLYSQLDQLNLPLDQPETLKVLASQLDAKDKYVRETAMIKILRLSSVVDAGILRRALQDESQSVRWRAYDHLQQHPREELIPLLVERMILFDRNKIMAVLASHGAVAQPQLLPLLDHVNAEVRMDVCRLLSEIGDADALPDLDRVSNADNRPVAEVLQARASARKIRSRTSDKNQS